MDCAAEMMSELKTFAPKSLQTSRRLISRIYGRWSACWCWQAGPVGRWICLREQTPDREICEYVVTKIPLIWLQWAQRPWSKIIPPLPLLRTWDCIVVPRFKIRSGRGQNKVEEQTPGEKIHLWKSPLKPQIVKITTVIFTICLTPHASALNLISAEMVKRCPSSSKHVLQLWMWEANVQDFSQWQSFQIWIGNMGQ